MRTTVNIDDQLLGEAKVLAARQHRTLGEIIDDSLRRTLAAGAGKPRRKVVLPVDGDPRGRLIVDLYDKDAIADLMGDNELPHADR